MPRTSALVFCNIFSIRLKFIVNLFGSMSTNTGFAPAEIIADTVAKAVCETVITSSPIPTFNDLEQFQ